MLKLSCRIIILLVISFIFLCISNTEINKGSYQTNNNNFTFISRASSRFSNSMFYITNLNYSTEVDFHKLHCHIWMNYTQDISNISYTLEVRVYLINNASSSTYDISNKTRTKLIKVNISTYEKIDESLTYYTDFCHPIKLNNFSYLSGIVSYINRNSTINKDFNPSYNNYATFDGSFLKLTKPYREEVKETYEEVNGIITNNSSIIISNGTEYNNTKINIKEIPPVILIKNFTKNLTENDKYYTEILKNGTSLENQFNLTNEQKMTINKNLSVIIDIFERTIKKNPNINFGLPIFGILDLSIQISHKTETGDLIGKAYSQANTLTDAICKSKMHNNTNFFASIESDTYTIQMFNSNRSSQIRNISINNNISTIDVSACISRFNNNKEVYIKKLDFRPYKDSSIPINVSLTMWELKNFTKNICKDVPIVFNIPSPDNTIINQKIGKIMQLQDKGINILDKYDPFFNDRCFYFTQNDTKQLTISERRKRYFFNKSVECSPSCKYSGIEENGYVRCKCVNATELISIHITTSFMISLSTLNFDVVKCLKTVIDKGIFFNIGFFINLILTVLFMHIIILYFHLNKNIDKKKCKLLMMIYHDGQFYDPNKVNAQDYFNKFNPIFQESNKELLQLYSVTRKNSNTVIMNDFRKCVIQMSIPEKKSYSFSVFKTIDEEKINYDPNIIIVPYPTYSDYFKLNAEELKLYDKRGFLMYLFIQLFYKHSLIYAFWSFSFLNPFYLRLFNFYTKICLFFSINALVYSDISVNKISLYLIDNGILVDSIVRIIISALITNLISLILWAFQYIPREVKNEFNNCLMTKNIIIIKHGNAILKKKMFWRYFGCFLLSISFIIFSWYYVICFCGIYIQASWNWFISALISLLVDWLILQPLIPLTITLIREGVIKKRKYL